MKKSWISVSLALFLAVIGAVSFTRCGSDGGLGVAFDAGDSATDAADLVDAADDGCDAFICDGDFGNDVTPGAATKGEAGDIYAITNIINSIWGGEGVNPAFYLNDILTELAADDLLPDVTEGTVPLAVTGSVTVPCGDGGTTVDADGSFTYILTFFGQFDGEGFDFEEDYEQTDVVSFANCLLEGDLLNTGGSASIRFNGSIRVTDRYRADATETDPARVIASGRITTSQSDDNGDTEGGDPFWEGPIDANGRTTGVYEVPVNPANVFTSDGGICFGSTVSLGTADDPEEPGNDTETTDDDECADEGSFLSVDNFPEAYYCDC